MTGRRAIAQPGFPYDPAGIVSGMPGVVADRLEGGAGFHHEEAALDEPGTLYIANHMQNTLTRLVPGGERIAIAGAGQGMAGCTACALTPADPGGHYVVTTGGIVQPLDGVVQQGKLVRLNAGVRGQPLAFRS